MAAVEIDLADIQGDILRAYGNRYDRTSYIFVGIDDAERGRAWLRGILPHVTTAEPWRGRRPDTTLNVAVTCSGLGALGVSKDVIETFSAEFRQGMAGRADELGDTDDGAPEHWEENLGRGVADVLLTINAQRDEDFERALAELQAGIEQSGLAVVHQTHARLLGDAREHFGFADGFAQPAVEGVNEEKTPGGGVPEKDGGWRPLALGEFILGYEDEQSRDDPRRGLPSAPDPPLGRSGTYMVWRKLHQDVAAFRRRLREAAAHYEGGDENRLAAKVVGRWRSGTPLVTSPDWDDPGFRGTTPGANDFRYAEQDPEGRACPIGAHIRRANPRDGLGFEGRLSFRHRIIRRGMPYGEALPAEETEDDGKPRGLVFVCFQASISRQFEGIQVQWLNDGNIFHLGHDKDFLLGDAAGTGKMTVQGDPPYFLAPQGSYVHTRGGEYLFVPGVTALAALADGTAG
jgi:Dyp-type peroxidase family